MTQTPRTPEGRVSLVANGGTINGSYGLPPGEALDAFRADLKELVERPMVDAYMAACRALHWRTAELRAHGVEPIVLPTDCPHYPPEDYDFGAGPAGDIAFLLSVIDSCNEAGSPPDEMDPEDVATIAQIRAAHPAVEPVAWVFELSRARMWDGDTPGDYCDWGPPQLSFTKPCVPEGSIRNLRPLRTA